MKKSLLLTLAAGLVCTTPIMAADLYITGSTAFRANVYTACTKLFDVTPSTNSGTLVFGLPATGGNYPQGGTTNGTPSKNTQWTMTGTVSNTVTALGQTPLTIHALFTGSVQGIQTVENSTKLTFLNIDGSVTNNSPTIGFSDCSSSATLTPVSGNFAEEKVAVQPFVFAKSAIGGVMNNITNVASSQLVYMIKLGRAPLSLWNGNTSDTNNFVYLVQRTKDSGTRLCFQKEMGGTYNSTATVYIFDNVTNNIFFKPSQGSGSVANVKGSAGNGNANYNWGPGYVAGSDVAAELGYNFPGNQALAALSIGDAKGIAGANWAEVIPFNGVWPTAAGAGIVGNTGTNDYSPITLGRYSFWGYEVVVYPTVDPSSVSSDQNLTAAILGDQNTAGTILGVLDAQSYNNGGTLITGSLENEIEGTKATGATAIRISDMIASRQAVGGSIAPF